MKIGTLFGLAALGGFAYAHNKRGGQMNLDSIKETARSLFGNVQERARSVFSQGTNSAKMYEGDNAELRH
jgi:hypothetical protein